MKNLTKNQKIATAVAILVVGFFFVFGQYIVSLFTTGQVASATQTTTTGASQVGIQDVQIGTGGVAEPGMQVTVNYVGQFTNGTVFDSSVSRGVPFTFVLGAGQVIPGWEQGIVGMKVGGKRILTIPPELGYGPNDYGPIPGNSTLIFQVELLNASQPSQVPAAQ